MHLARVIAFPPRQPTIFLFLLFLYLLFIFYVAFQNGILFLIAFQNGTLFLIEKLYILQ
jgi:hypothetical protein